jgi:hypothetical protein
MAEASLFALLSALARADVDFVVVGGVAVVLQASPRFTKDLDIVYADDQENLERLASVLLAHDTRLRGAEDVPFVADARALRQTQILTLTTTLGELDLLLRPDGAPPYAELREAADRYDIDGVTVRVASIDDLIAMKRAAGRPQDGMDVAALEIARRER